jgi:hypothetical protein
VFADANSGIRTGRSPPAARYGPRRAQRGISDISIAWRIPNLRGGVTPSTGVGKNPLLENIGQPAPLAPGHESRYGRAVKHDGQSEEPIGAEVPIADAVEQRFPVDETPELSEDIQPTETSRIAAEEQAPVDVDPADWQEQRIAADIGADEWDREL